MINGAWLKQSSFGGKYLAGKYLLLLPIEKENYLLKYIFFSLKWVKYLADSALKDFCNTFKEIVVVFPHAEFWLHVLFVYFHWACTCGITLKHAVLNDIHLKSPSFLVRNKIPSWNLKASLCVAGVKHLLRNMKLSRCSLEGACAGIPWTDH